MVGRVILGPPTYSSNVSYIQVAEKIVKQKQTQKQLQRDLEEVLIYLWDLIKIVKQAS